MAVMLGHLRGLFFVTYPGVAKRNPLVGMVYILTSLGHQAVLVFFVLSGFFISRSVLDAFRKGRWSWKIFLVNRLTRLLLVLVPGLILCLLWDRIGMHLPWAGSYYYHSIPDFGDYVIARNSTASIFTGNLLFLQSIYFPPFGSAMPLWSLSYEFWYYILFPTTVIILSRGKPVRQRLAYGLGATLIVLMVGKQIALLFLVWLAGAGVGLLHDLRPKFLLRRYAFWPSFGCGVFGAASLLLVKEKALGGLTSDFLVAVAFLPLMFVLVEAAGPALSDSYASIAKVLASFSYTLYIVHLPLLVFVRTLLGREARWQPDVRHAAYGLVLAALVTAYSYGISQVTEARTDALRRRILSAV